VGYLDKMSVQEAQQEQDELLLHTENFSAESNEGLLNDNDDDILPSLSTGPTAPPPAHECNVSVPTPGVRRSPRLQAKDKGLKTSPCRAL
jgi:hypothetical protein